MSSVMYSLLPFPFVYTNNAIEVGSTRSFSRCELRASTELIQADKLRCSTMYVPFARASRR